jgi:hypothetical protein
LFSLSILGIIYQGWRGLVMTSIVHLKNKKTGTVYVYESTGYWDKEKQQARNRRICLGKLDPETGEIIPSKRVYIAT